MREDLHETANTNMRTVYCPAQTRHFNCLLLIIGDLYSNNHLTVTTYYF